jgi:hypothetical protein
LKVNYIVNVDSLTLREFKISLVPGQLPWILMAEKTKTRQSSFAKATEDEEGKSKKVKGKKFKVQSSKFKAQSWRVN